MPFLLSLFLTISFCLELPQSGQWIISNDENNVNLKEIDGCIGRPTILSFENQTIELC